MLSSNQAWQKSKHCDERPDDTAPFRESRSTAETLESVQQPDLTNRRFCDLLPNKLR